MYILSFGYQELVPYFNSPHSTAPTRRTGKRELLDLCKKEERVIYAATDAAGVPTRPAYKQGESKVVH